MTATDPGHLFVVHGDLTHIGLNAVAVPTDVTWDVRPHWGRFVPEGDRQPRWQEPGVSERVDVDGVVVRYVDSGFTERTTDDDELARRVEAGARALASDLTLDATSPGARAGRPIVGLPLFGVGEGGWAERRGAALTTVGARIASVARETGVDFAVVCFNRSDYAAMQQEFGDREWTALSDDERAEADRLGRAARQGSLALFLGAGVSMAADLPSYGKLLEMMGATPAMLAKEPPVAAQELLEALGPAKVQVELKRVLATRTRCSLQHALLASLSVEDVVTTNFDALYELAARTAFEEPPAVLPWDPPASRSPYVMKLHGDPDRDDFFVLSVDHFASFTNEHAAERSVLQALTLMGRELLFVGYGLRDENVLDVLDDTARRTADLGAKAARRMATVLDVEPAEDKRLEHVVRLGLRRADEDGYASRRLEVFLDRMAWTAAAKESSWVMDRRYADLLSAADEPTVDALRELKVPGSSHWSGLLNALRGLGWSRE